MLHALLHRRAVGRTEDEVHAAGGVVAVEGEAGGGGGEMGGDGCGSEKWGVEVEAEGFGGDVNRLGGVR